MVAFTHPDDIYGMSETESSPEDYLNNAAQYVSTNGAYTNGTDYSLLRCAQSCTICSYPVDSGVYGGTRNSQDKKLTSGNYTFCTPMDTLTGDDETSAYHELCGVIDSNDSVVPYNCSCVVSAFLACMQSDVGDTPLGLA